jgi:hypothetical protein
MERKELKIPYVDNLLKWGRTDLVAEQKKSADEVLFWEECLKSEDPLVLRQAKGNIESARGRLQQLNDYLAFKETLKTTTDGTQVHPLQPANPGGEAEGSAQN